ncbi:hypothetical protein [Pseudomonas phage KP1]|uniref:Uncharacterized protein n=1 Tax=Pseudomonas phage KP1 TaxID=2562463 RepID=A0A6G5QAI1_9CAUD|nr:hypothetical protein PM391_gp36 [Pseudomonas phage KP1]QBZ71746.1 hypothetical protein [Pseudomonas phage KP1]
MTTLNKKQKADFAGLQAAINASADGFIYAAAAAVAPFVAAGLVETNEAIVDGDGNIAVRLSATAGEAGATANEAPKVKTVSKFQIDANIPVPTITGRGRGGNTYPFDLLEVGQSFFVPNTEDKPNAAKSLASTVSSATARHAVPSADGATKVNKQGETVPVMVETRKFVVRSVDETAEGRGPGARVWRTV